jgi:hypothetical protein
LERWLVHFLEMRLRARGRPELQALADRCLWIVARTEGASEAQLESLEAEVELLRRELGARRRVRRPVLH